MATFNGSRHIEEQMLSILRQLDPGDEVVVVDDGSTDATVDILRALDDHRLRIIQHDRNRGHVRTFADAMEQASCDVILLADQDDVWLAGRVDRMTAALSRCAVVASSLEQFADDGEPRPTLSLDPQTSTDSWGNVLRIFLGRIPYYGCAMGFRADFRDIALPIPDYVESHDLWLALAGNTVGSMTHLEEPTVARRLHDANLSPTRRRLLPAAIRTRVRFVRALTSLRYRRLARRGRAIA